MHSLSRFFRDLFEFAALRADAQARRASRSCRSRSRPATTPPARWRGSIFSLFDEYQSKENGKHTLRAMKENARQGFFNGSRPPFGFETVETEAIGNKGQEEAARRRRGRGSGRSAHLRSVPARPGWGRDGRQEIAAHLNARGHHAARRSAGRVRACTSAVRTRLHGRLRLQPEAGTKPQRASPQASG